MKVEIINHDHLAIDADLEVVPRVGEIFTGTTEKGDKISGTVRDVEHSYNGAKGQHSVTVYLAP